MRKRTSNYIFMHAFINVGKDSLVGFSLISNSRKLLGTEKNRGGGQLTCLNGLRVFSLFWVIMSHASQCFLDPYAINNILIMFPEVTKCLAAHWISLTNQKIFFKITGNYWFQAVTNGYVCLDTFFFMTGLLLAYLSFKELDKTQGKMNIIMFYVHRYIRYAMGLFKPN